MALQLGMDVSMREQTEQNIKNDIPLLPKQNNGVIHSLNYQVLKQFGRSRPGPVMCRYFEKYIYL